MKWKVIFGVLFVLSVVMTIIYANKSMIIYNKSSIENVPAPDGGSFFEEKVVRTYQDNYASIGGAIGFSILGAASLVAFSIHLRKDKG